jgi:Tol biopolymer transport system component
MNTTAGKFSSISISARAIIATASLAAFLVPAMAAGNAQATPQTKRVTLRSNGQEVNYDTEGYATVSGNGRYVAFESPGKFTPGDDGFDYDIFVHDRTTGTTLRASTRSNGKEVPGANSKGASISANGRLVAFISDGALVPGDNNGQDDIYVKNIKTGKVALASVRSDGSQIAYSAGTPSLSANGRYVAYVSDGPFVGTDSNGYTDVFRHDLKTGKTILVSLRSTGDQTNKDSTDPSISGDGNRIAFATSDDSMTADTDNQNDTDVFVRDVKAATTVRASLKSDGTEPYSGVQTNEEPAISANGRFVVFNADAEGTFVTDDNDNDYDVYVHDLKTGKTGRVSLPSSAAAMSSDGGSDQSTAPVISCNGRYVAFGSPEPLVTVDTNNQRDIYLRDRKTQTTKRVSVRSNGQEVSSYSAQYPAISEDGHWVAFASPGAYTSNDSGVEFDVFERGPLG